MHVAELVVATNGCLLLAMVALAGCEPHLDETRVWTYSHRIVETPHTLAVGESYPRDPEAQPVITVRDIDAAAGRCLGELSFKSSDGPAAVWLSQNIRCIHRKFIA